MPRPKRSRQRRHITPRAQLRIENLETRDMPSFVTATSFTVGANSGGLVPQGSDPTAVAVGDFNGDGKKDVVAANGSGVGVTLLLGKGNGGFLPVKNSVGGPSASHKPAADDDVS